MKATRRQVLHGAAAGTLGLGLGSGAVALTPAKTIGDGRHNTGDMWLNTSDETTWVYDRPVLYVVHGDGLPQRGRGTLVKDGSGWKLLRG